MVYFPRDVTRDAARVKETATFPTSATGRQECGLVHARASAKGSPSQFCPPSS